MRPIRTYQIFDYAIANIQIDDFCNYIIERSKIMRSNQSQGSAGAEMTVLANTHVLMEGLLSRAYKNDLQQADYLLPDGMPLVWIARVKKIFLKKRVSGPELMAKLLDLSRNADMSHYFYGGYPGAQAAMVSALMEKYPGIRIAGCESPPFRPPTEEEDAATISRINASGANYLWVGLGCPKQEMWMRQHKNKLSSRIVMFGVGQAFDVLSGRVSRPPVWLGDIGFEWLYRLCLNPGRLWKRYLVYAPMFFMLFFIDEVRRFGHRHKFGKL